MPGDISGLLTAPRDFLKMNLLCMRGVLPLAPGLYNFSFMDMTDAFGASCTRNSKHFWKKDLCLWGFTTSVRMFFTLWMDRFVLTDAQWARMEPHCLGKPTDPGRSGRNNRLFMEAVLWIARTGSPWRDLPKEFGNWSTAFRRFSDWRRADVFKRIFDACSDEPDMEYAMVDATIVKVHRHGQGAKGGLKARP